MKDRIFAFLIHASADGSQERFPAGRRHVMLIFARQEESEPNWALCESIAKNAGWVNPERQGASLATPDSIQKMQKAEDPAVQSAYADAVRQGFAILVFSVPVSPTR